MTEPVRLELLPPATPVSHRAGELLEPLAAREHVRLTLAEQRQTVPDGRREPEPVPEALDVTVVEESLVLDGVESHERRGGPEGRPDRTVLELQELDGPLDVGDPARPELDVALRVRPARDALLLDARLHPQGRRAALRVEAAHEGLRRSGPLEASAEFTVAGDAPDPEHRLPLPRLGPALPVGLVGGERARQRPVASFGPQVSVDVEGTAVRGDRGQRRDDVGGDRERERVRRLLVRTVRDLVHEEDIEVRRVGQLRTGERAHPEDREAHRKVVG